MRRFAPRLFAQLFCIPLLSFCVSSFHAQSRRRPTTQEQIQNREWALPIIRREVTVNEVARQKLVAQLALRDDFRKLQVLNNQLMKRVFKPAKNQTISQKEIRSSLGEIKKLAERLRLNFGLPRIDADGPANLALKPGLLQLDKAIISFVDNPLFEHPKVYDTELASRAAKDLGEVIKLAELLRKLAKDAELARL